MKANVSPAVAVIVIAVALIVVGVLGYNAWNGGRTSSVKEPVRMNSLPGVMVPGRPPARK